MPLKRCVTMPAPASAAARAPSKSTVLWPSATTIPRARSERTAARPGSASGASVTSRMRCAEAIAQVLEPVEVDVADELRRMRARRAAEERAFEMHAEHRVGPGRAHGREPVEHGGVRDRGARCRSSASTRCSRRRRTRRSWRPSLPPKRSRSRRGPSRSPGCRRSRGRAPRHPRSTAPSGGGPLPVATMRPSPITIQAGDADVPPSPLSMRAATSAVTRGGPGTMRCAASPSRAVYGALALRSTCGPAAALRPRPGSPRCCSPSAFDAQDELGVEEILAERARPRERFDRGAVHGLDAVRVGDVQAERDAQHGAEHRGRELAHRGALVVWRLRRAWSRRRSSDRSAR